MRKWFIPLYLAVVFGNLGAAGYGGLVGLPGLIVAGLALTGAAPAGFLLWRWRAAPEETGPQALLVSALTGFGCVLMMVQVYRFGDEFRWALGLGLAALAGWLIYTRWILRPTEHN